MLYSIKYHSHVHVYVDTALVWNNVGWTSYDNTETKEFGRDYISNYCIMVCN